MLYKKQSIFRWQIVLPISVISTLILLLVSITPVASKEIDVQLSHSTQLNVPLFQTPVTPTLQSSDLSTATLQTTATPTATLQSDTSILTSTVQGDLSGLSFTLEELGYNDAILESPLGNVGYRFRLPPNWLIQGNNNFLVLDLSYEYYALDSTAPLPSVFGDVTVFVNNEKVEVFPIVAEFEHQQLQIQLPASLFADSSRDRNTIDVVFDASSLCEIPHDAQLTVHGATSQIFFDYELVPIVIHLSQYPQPFYQQSSFLVDNARFVLPSSQTSTDATNAIRIAAKLGDLANGRLPISTTLDIELADLVSTSSPVVLDENFIVLGRPDNNQILSLLNETTDLPVPFYERQLELSSQGPTVISPGDTFSYTFTATNTSTQDVTVSLVDALPLYTQLMECQPNCATSPGAGTVTWENNSLAPDESVSFSLTLNTTTLISDEIVVDNTVSLIEEELGLINANTLSTTITTVAKPSAQQISHGNGSDYVFEYDQQAVAEEDGIIQEIVSPWNENRVILIVTGLSDAAVTKASLAVNNHLPSGPVALVKDVTLTDLNLNIDPPPINMTFQDLGYDDVTLVGGLNQEAEYRFTLPYGLQLSNDTYLDFNFGHTQILAAEGSSVTINLNGDPMVSFPLNEETVSLGSIRVNLPREKFRPGDNRINIATKVQPLVEACNQNRDDVWFTIKASSELFLNRNRNELSSIPLNLDNFPYPFDAQPTLVDLLLALPEIPTQQQWTDVLNLAAILGDSADGDIIASRATLGADSLSDETLSNYHIIAMGQPTVNPLTAQVNSQLPQPFIPNSNEIERKAGNTVFRSILGVDLGLIQLIPSPWNEERAFLAITGNTEEGVHLSMAATTRGRGLNYKLVLVQPEKLEAIDVSGLLESGVANALATAAPELVTTATPTPMVEMSPTPATTPEIESSEASQEEAQFNERPAWLTPLIVGNILAILVIFAVAIWQSRRRK